MDGRVVLEVTVVAREMTAARLKEARDWALASDEFNMLHWGWVRVDLDSKTSCGTTRCLAGYGASRRRPILWNRAVKQSAERAIALKVPSGPIGLLGVNLLSVSDEGREWFGITEDEASDLFHASSWNWLERINELIEEYSE